MRYGVLQYHDTSEIEKLLIRDGLFVPVAYKELEKFPQEAISVFCVQHALYQVPTIELIDFLKSEITGIPLEIGAGNGVIGRSLGIRMVDNHMQSWSAIKPYYANLNQPTITYGKDVERMGGNYAVKKYKPDTIIACWLTQKYQHGMEKDANMYGVNEVEFFSEGIKKYIHVGNTHTHDNKILFNTQPCKRYKFPWLISRSMSREENIIYVFSQKN